MDVRNFLIFLSLLISMNLFSLQLDEYIEVDHLLICLPLWLLWKLPVFASEIASIIVILKQFDNMRIRMVATMHNLFLHILLMTFEWLVCLKLNSQNDELWIKVFFPLILASSMCGLYCIWCCRYDFPVYNLELFIAANLCVIVLIALRLDLIITCSWEITFLPLLIILFGALLKILYSLIFCGMASMYGAERSEKRTIRVILGGLIFIPVFVFQALLVDNLDDHAEIPITLVTLPLSISMMAGIVLSFLSYSYNFGSRNYCLLLAMMGIHGDVVFADICCCCSRQRDEVEVEMPHLNENNEEPKTPVAVAPRHSIDTPD